MKVALERRAGVFQSGWSNTRSRHIANRILKYAEDGDRTRGVLRPLNSM
jgi:hypothetical protein